MKKIIFLLLFVNFCFSQEDKISWQKIDSITNVLSPTFKEIKTIENYLKPKIELTFCDDVESWLNEKINEISSTLIEKNVNLKKPQ
jgi:hypothetical protein